MTPSGQRVQAALATVLALQVSTAVVSKTDDAEMPIYFTNGHFDRKAVEVVKRSLIDMGQLDKMPGDKDLFTEKFLPNPAIRWPAPKARGRGSGRRLFPQS